MPSTPSSPPCNTALPDPTPRPSYSTSGQARDPPSTISTPNSSPTFPNSPAPPRPTPARPAARRPPYPTSPTAAPPNPSPPPTDPNSTWASDPKPPSPKDWPTPSPGTAIEPSPTDAIPTPSNPSIDREWTPPSPIPSNPPAETTDAVPPSTGNASEAHRYFPARPNAVAPRDAPPRRGTTSPSCPRWSPPDAMPSCTPFSWTTRRRRSPRRARPSGRIPCRMWGRGFRPISGPRRKRGAISRSFPRRVRWCGG
mmetsp:Transcript_5929/g.13100  ORF Transcript_5929/g.13100 Transcript_5929/m.13100 type:complete len:254 (+) Transcript_5929:1757-2518(+)